MSCKMPRQRELRETLDLPVSPEKIVEKEFDVWARQGRADALEAHHRDMLEEALPLMDLRRGERVLDLGCGTGWAARFLASHVADNQRLGEVVGLDLSHEMINRAKATTQGTRNVRFWIGSAYEIGCADECFDKVISIETFQFIPNQTRALRELFSVIAPGGRLFLLMHLYRENTYAVHWPRSIPAQVRSEPEYIDLLRQVGFCKVQSTHIRDAAPVSRESNLLARGARELLQQPPHQWIPLLWRKLRTAMRILRFKRLGALLLIAEKPHVVQLRSSTTSSLDRSGQRVA